MSDAVEIIPHFQARDARSIIRGDVSSGVGNMRMLVALDSPGFSIGVAGTELAASIAETIREALVENFSQGLDAQGSPLPAISEETRRRRTRRRFQREDDLNAKAERFKLRGRGQKGTSFTAGQATAAKRQSINTGGKGNYTPFDRETPFHESGLAAENVAVQFKGTESGNPVFLIALPSGGKERGLVNDDGRGARLFAAQHYGFERMMDIPHALDADIDRQLEGHLSDVLAAGGSTLAMFGKLIGKIGAVVEAGASGELAEE